MGAVPPSSTQPPAVAHGAVGGIDFLDVIFISHTLLETWLGLIKLRGRYQHEATNKPIRSAAYTRHHGASILALALLSHLVYSRGLVRSPTGQLASAVLATFHGGAVASFTHAWLSGAMPFTKILIPHGPYAAFFAWHAWWI